MAEKASWQTSTLSQAFLGSVIWYSAMLLICAVALFWGNANVEHVKLVVGWSSVFQGVITSAYLTARKTNGNGGSHVQTPS